MRTATAPVRAPGSTARGPGRRTTRENRHWVTRLGRTPGSEAGYSTVETVLLLPLLVLFTLLVVQYALAWHARNVAESAARIGVAHARAYTATDADGLRQSIQYLRSVDPALLRAAHIEVTRTATTATVRIRAQVLPVPGIPITSDIDERSSGPIERFVAGAGP